MGGVPNFGVSIAGRPDRRRQLGDPTDWKVIPRVGPARCVYDPGPANMIVDAHRLDPFGEIHRLGRPISISRGRDQRPACFPDAQ
jgi:hypothetical protein